MSYAVLVATNQEIISEFQRMVAVTESQLIVQTIPDQAEIAQAYRVFVESSEAAENLSHEEIVIVCEHVPDVQAWKLAVTLNAKAVVALSDSREWLLSNLVTPMRKTAEMICLLPIVGGAGASTLASAMSVQSASTGKQVCLVDLDPQGGGIDVVCGAEEIPGARWSDVLDVENISGADVMRSLPECAGVRILAMRCDSVTPEKVEQILAALMSVCDVIYVDLAQGMNDYWPVVSQLSNQILLVLPTTVRATTVAKRILENQEHDRFGLVVRQLPGTGLTPLAIAQTLGVPLKAQIATDTRVVEQIEQGVGLGRVALGAFSKQVSQLCTSLEFA